MVGMQKYFKSGIVVERYTETRDDFGGIVEAWVTHLEIEGRIRPLSGNERLASSKETLFANYRLYCNVADIKNTDRVVYDGKTYNIKFVADPMDFGRFLQVDLEKVV